MRIVLKKRENITPELRILSKVISVIIGLLLASVIFLLYNINPFYAYFRILMAGFGSAFGISETITKMIPLLLCSLGLILPYKAKIWNIGSDGQLILGAIFASGIALNYPYMPQSLLLLLMFSAGFFGGVLWAFIPALLKTRLNTNEIITTLMLNFVADYLLSYLVCGPWKGKETWGFPYTSIFSSSATLPVIPGTRIHYPTLIVGLFALVIVFIMMKYTKFGYEIRILGLSKEAARYSGISFEKVVLITMIISGGLAGVAGVGEVAGIYHRLEIGISSGYGYTSIVVAWLSDLSPLGAIFSSFFISLLLVGGDAIQVELGMPGSIVNIFNGLLLLSILASDFFLRYKIVGVKYDRANY